VLYFLGYLKLSDKVDVTIAVVKKVEESENSSCLKIRKEDIFCKQRLGFTVCCTAPYFLDKTKMIETTLRCKSCKNTVHMSCIGNFEEKQSFTCPLCTLNLDGIQWGAGVQNSCSFDAVFQALLIKCDESLDLKQEILKTKYHKDSINIGIGHAINHGLRGSWAKMHQAWALAIGKGNDIFGSLDENVWEPLKNGCQFARTISCSNCQAIQNDKTTYLPQFKINLSVTENFQALFFDGVHERDNCHECHKGKKRETGYKPCSEQTWFLHLTLENSPHTAEECFFEAPRSIQFGVTEFELAGMIICNVEKGN